MKYYRTTKRCIVIAIILVLNRLFFLIIVTNQYLTYGFDVTTTVPKKNHDRMISFDILKGKRILVVGGSGRVGGSVTTQLIQHGATVIVGGTNINHFYKSKQRWIQLFPNYEKEIQNNIQFCTLHREQTETIMKALKQYNQSIDLVVNTAGPFQGKVNSFNGVIEACLQSQESNKNNSNRMNQIPYIDVCDDYCTAMAIKTKYSSRATMVPCIVSTGCWPGVSSLMAKQLIYNVIEQKPNIKQQDMKIDFSFFTAGSGGAGVTLLVATFLILAEHALTIVNGRRIPVQPMKEYITKNFGPMIGNKSVSHLNLLETASIHETLGINNVASYFGTAPNLWNTLLGFMARTIPSSILSNEDIMTKLSIFSIPIVRLVDYFAGATNAMRCDVSWIEDTNDKNKKNTLQQVSAIYGHENLEPCVGECVTAFCCAALLGGDVIRSGVWFPEEAIPKEYVSSLLALASIGAHTTEAISSANGIQLKRDQIWGIPAEKQNTIVPKEQIVLNE